MTGSGEINRLRAEYASRADDELMMLAGDMASLTDEARLVLGEAIMKRGLQSPEPLPESSDNPISESQPDAHRLVTVRWFGNISDAWPAKSRLDSAGIESFLGDENMGRLFSVAVGGVKLQVRFEDVQCATEVLESEAEAFVADDPQSTE